MDVLLTHYNDVTMGATASQITSVAFVYSTVYSEKTSKSRVTGVWEGDSPVTGEFPAQMAKKMFPFDDIILTCFKSGVLMNDYHLFCFVYTEIPNAILLEQIEDIFISKNSARVPITWRRLKSVTSHSIQTYMHKTPVMYRKLVWHSTQLAASVYPSGY